MVIGITSDQTCLVILISSPGPLLNRTAAAEGVIARPISMTRTIAPLADLRALFQIAMVLIRERPLLTDFSTPKAGLLGNLAAWALRVPHRVYTLRGLKLESSHGWKRGLLLASERMAAACAHAILCNSSSLREMAARYRIAPAGKLRILGDGSSNGVDTRRFCPGLSPVREEWSIPAGAQVIGYVGRLTRDKGIPELLVAFETILEHRPDAWLLLVGWVDAAEDALDSASQSLIATHPRIRKTGFVPDTAPYYRAMDLLILPTHREGFPNVALEAAASGVPVITTECTGAKDAVLPEVTGLLIPPHQPMAIADAVLELLADPARCARMGAAGRVWVAECFSREKVLALAVDFYRSLIAGRGN
jgi:glycosyltransferase involved in cell wall biosynthesis